MDSALAVLATVRALVEPHLDHIFDGGLRDVVGDTGGAGLCRHASRELIKRVGRGRLLYIDFRERYVQWEGPRRGCVGPRQPVPGWVGQYRRSHSSDACHVVAVIDGVIVDLTARQFRADLPFPMFVVADAETGGRA